MASAVREKEKKAERERERGGGKRKRERGNGDPHYLKGDSGEPSASLLQRPPFSPPPSPPALHFRRFPLHTNTRFRVRLLRQHESLIRTPLSLVTPLNEGPTVFSP